LVVGIGAVWLVGTLANQAPAALTGQASAARNVLILLAAGGLVILVWSRVLRRPGKRRQPVLATVPGLSGAGTTVQTGTEFEREVVDLLAELDFRRVDHVGGPGDGGVDIIAEDYQGRTFLVQCKRFAPGKKVGSVDIQKLIGAVVHQDADGGIFVTTASFTAAATNLAQSGRVPIELIDGQGLARLSRAVA
jgi:restriction system protein